MKSKYSLILNTMPAIEGDRKKIIFRAAREWILVEYGEEQVFDLLDTFRLFAVMEKLKKKQIPGLIDYGNGFRTMIYKYDPKVISARELIKYIKDVEEEIGSVKEISFKLRLIKLSIVFKDSATRAAIEKVCK